MDKHVPSVYPIDFCLHDRVKKSQKPAFFLSWKKVIRPEYPTVMVQLTNPEIELSATLVIIYHHIVGEDGLEPSILIT